MTSFNPIHPAIAHASKPLAQPAAKSIRFGNEPPKDSPKDSIDPKPSMADVFQGETPEQVAQTLQKLLADPKGMAEIATKIQEIKNPKPQSPNAPSSFFGKEFDEFIKRLEQAILPLLEEFYNQQEDFRAQPAKINDLSNRFFQKVMEIAAEAQNDFG